jgi:serine/threonine protein kinase
LKDVESIESQIKQHFLKSQTNFATKVDFYRIGRTLGRGAFGKVSLCLHKLSHTLVAIKSVKKNAGIDVK